MDISKRISLIKNSLTLSISAKAKQMRKDGIDVIGFGAGEPDFDTPPHIKEAAKRAIEEGFTKYTPASGTMELKRAVCDKLKEDNELEYKEDEVIISCGAKHSLFNAVCSLCNDNDEVIIPSPFWVSYPEMVRAAGANPIFVPADEKNGFKINPDILKNAITHKTKLFILNSPSNPTGAVYEKNELREIAGVLLKHNIICISDEIYEKIIYDGNFSSIASLGENIKNITVVVNGVSKSYAMTGWRIGYAASNRKLIKAMSNLQSHSTSNPASISQAAALQALKGPQGCIKDMVREFKKRRDFIVDALNDIEGISCFKPQGAFYVFPSIKKLLGKKFRGNIINNSLQFADYLLEYYHVALVAGEAFGCDGFIRISYAASFDNIKEGIKRIADFVGKLE